MLRYCAVAWTLLNTDATALRVFERKVLRKICPVRVGDDFRIRFNSQLYELLNDMDVVQRINIQQLRWQTLKFTEEEEKKRNSNNKNYNEGRQHAVTHCIKHSTAHINHSSKLLCFFPVTGFNCIFFCTQLNTKTV